MARTRVIYQNEALYCSMDVPYSGNQTGTLISPGGGDGGGNFNVMDLNRVQSISYSFNVARQDVNQFGELAAIDQCIVEAPTVSLDASYYLSNFTNEHRLGFFVTQSGEGTTYASNQPRADSTATKSCITNIIDSTSNAYQKSYYILTAKEGKDANYSGPTGVPCAKSGDYESVIGIGNGFLSSYSTEGSVGGMPTVSFSVEGQNMNFVSLPDLSLSGDPATGDIRFCNGFRVSAQGQAAGNTLVGISGENPAVNPVDGTKYGSSVCLPVPSGNPTGTMGEISTLRPGDITLTLAKQTGNAVFNAATGVIGTDGFTASQRGMQDPDYAGVNIENAHIQSYNISFDLSRTPIQKLGVKYAYARPTDFPINISLSLEAIVSDLTTGSLADMINCDDAFDARITLKDPTCTVSPKPEVCNYVIKGLKLNTQSFSQSIGDNQTVSLDFSTQIGGPEQKSKGLFMSGYHMTGSLDHHQVS